MRVPALHIETDTQYDSDWCEYKHVVVLKFGNAEVKRWVTKMYEPDTDELEQFVAAKLGEVLTLMEGLK